MKQKLTLSLKASRVAMLRKASARKATSISELVEEFAKKADAEPTEEIPGILRWAGFWAEHLTPADFDGDDRLGEELRKTKAYERLEREKRTKR